MIKCAIAATALLFTLASCGGNPEPKPLPKPAPSVSTTPTPSPSAPAPALPEAAKPDSKVGAIAFAQHYIALINHAQSTGDTAPLAAVELPACSSCTSGREYLDGIWKSGGSIEGGQLVIESIDFALADPTVEGWAVGALVTFGPQTIKRPAPAKAEELKGGDLPMTIKASFTPEGWRVAQWTRAR